MTDLGIDVRNLVRAYDGKDGGTRRALGGISFAVPYGQVVGLLGPNGAGKTTCVKVLATLLSPTAGTVVVAGADVERAPRAVQRACGLSFGGDGGLYGRLSAFDNLRFFGTMYGLRGRALRRRATALLARVGLEPRAGDRVETFSRGMRQRLHIARALLHDPGVLLLDEPSGGLDPESARTLRDLVRQSAAEGRAVLLTTHNMAEAESVCDRVLVLVDGRIARAATPTELREDAARSLGTVIAFQAGAALPGSFFDEFPGLLDWSRQDRSWRVRCIDAAAGAAFVLGRLEGGLRGLQISPPTLEDAYLEMVR